MKIVLMPELEQLIEHKIHSGRYVSAREEVSESLKLLRTHEDSQDLRIRQLNQAIDMDLEGLKQGKKS